MTPEQDPQSGSPEPTAGPVVDPGTPAVDWESTDNPYRQRFETYRVEADRRNTTLSQYEQAIEDFRTGDASERRRAAAILKMDDLLEIPDETPETFDDPYEELRAQNARLDERLTAREQAEQQAEYAAQFAQAVDKGLEKISGLTTEEDKNQVVARAMQMAPSQDKLVDYLAPAYEALKARDEALIKEYETAWRAGKTAPTSIQPGTTATQKRNPEDLRDSSGQLTAEGLDYYAQRAEDRTA